MRRAMLAALGAILGCQSVLGLETRAFSDHVTCDERGCRCADAFATCGAEACATRIVDDANNCGACGRTCATSCNNGRCEPEVLGVTPDPLVSFDVDGDDALLATPYLLYLFRGGEKLALMPDPSYQTLAAITRGAAYFQASDQALDRFDLASQEVTSIDLASGFRGPILRSADALFWWEEPGPSAVTLAEVRAGANVVTAHATFASHVLSGDVVYDVDLPHACFAVDVGVTCLDLRSPGAQAVVRAPLAPGAVRALAVRGDDLFYATIDGIFRASIALESAPVRIDDAPDVLALAATDDALVSSHANGELVRSPRTGAPRTVLAEAQAFQADRILITTDKSARHVVWASINHLLRTPL
jgi:hypothetical protein